MNRVQIPSYFHPEKGKKSRPVTYEEISSSASRPTVYLEALQNLNAGVLQPKSTHPHPQFKFFLFSEDNLEQTLPETGRHIF